MASMFSSPKAPEIPAMPEPAVMPEADDEAIRAAKRKKAAEAASRSGRTSTILTEQTDKLGG